MYIYNNSTGKYAYYEEIDSGRAGIIFTLPSASNYTYGMMSRMQNPTSYYSRITF